MKELLEHYENQIQAWHLFFESFDNYLNSIAIVRGISIEMNSELIKFAKSNPNSPKIEISKKRIDTLLGCMDVLDGLTSRCVKQSAQLKKNKEMYFELEKENESLRNDILALTQSLEDETN